MPDPPAPEPEDPVDKLLAELGRLLKGDRDSTRAILAKVAELEAANAKLNSDLRKTMGDRLREWLEEET